MSQHGVEHIMRSGPGDDPNPRADPRRASANVFDATRGASSPPDQPDPEETASMEEDRTLPPDEGRNPPWRATPNVDADVDLGNVTLITSLTNALSGLL